MSRRAGSRRVVHCKVSPSQGLKSVAKGGSADWAKPAQDRGGASTVKACVDQQAKRDDCSAKCRTSVSIRMGPRGRRTCRLNRENRSLGDDQGPAWRRRRGTTCLRGQRARGMDASWCVVCGGDHFIVSSCQVTSHLPSRSCCFRPLHLVVFKQSNKSVEMKNRPSGADVAEGLLQYHLPSEEHQRPRIAGRTPSLRPFPPNILDPVLEQNS